MILKLSGNELVVFEVLKNRIILFMEKDGMIYSNLRGSKADNNNTFPITNLLH